ncbi:MAG: THUMP domain-containing class I SAM-dependent RNA methyltransferase [Kiritimatiellia bacterium]|jgi:23S rRNA G2445 N2-methylase RlmL
MNPVFTEEPSTLVVTCSGGIAPYLSQELESLGFRPGCATETSVETEGTLADCMRLNLHLRTAHRVLYTLDRFRARNAGQLYANLVEIPWERYLDANGYFSVDRAVDNPTILDTQYAALKVKDAVVDRMRAACGRRPDSGNIRDEACLFLHWADNAASIYIDTTGESLNFRGYRAASSAAPIRESLAAALVMATGWDGRGNFLNPMCGGGTIAIEALWMAQRRAPALKRENFAFMHLACFEPTAWTQLRSEAVREFERHKDVACKIVASDIDPEMIDATRENLALAGGAEHVECAVGDITISPVPETAERGVILLNPPYGGRMGDPVRLRNTYLDIGGFLEAHADAYDGFVFTGNPDLAEDAGLTAADRETFYSGKIECKLLKNPRLSPEALAQFRRRDARR